MHHKCRTLHYYIICTGYLLAVGADNQQVIITSIVPDQQLFCPGKQVIISCTTIGSPILTWRSNEYIKGDGIEIGSFRDPGYVDSTTMSPDTIATLIDKNMTENGEQILVSELRIITSANYSTASITCLNEDRNMNSTGVQVLENPRMPQNLKANQRNDSGFCIILIQWDPPASLAADVSYYSVQVNESERINETSTLISYRACACASQSIQVSAVNFCEREGPSIQILLDQNPTPLLNIGLQCDAPATTQSPSPNEGNSSNDRLAVGLGVFLPMLAITIIAVIITLAIIFCLLKRTTESWSEVCDKFKINDTAPGRRISINFNNNRLFMIH